MGSAKSLIGRAYVILKDRKIAENWKEKKEELRENPHKRELFVRSVAVFRKEDLFN